MKIKLTGGVVVEAQKRQPGEEIEVADRFGRQLIGRGKAVEILQVKKQEEKPKAAPKKKRAKKLTLEE